MFHKALRMVQAVGVPVVVGVVVIAVSIGTAGVAFAEVPTLSQTSITVGVGQSLSVTSENSVDAYIGSNTSSNIVSASANGTQITVTGIAPGSADLSICGVGTASDCTTLYITVQATAVTSLSFNPNSISLTIGGSQAVTISGGNGNYSISSNSNTSVASTNLSGSSLTVTGVEDGSASIEVCDTSNNCGTFSVAVGSSTSGSLTFSANDISLTPGSNQTITVSGGNGSYEIATNSNSNVVSTGISNNNGIVIDALTSGSATITVCDTSDTNTCGTLSVTVTGSSSNSSNNSGTVSFSVASPSVAAGQTLNVTLSGGSTTYIVLSNQTATVASANITGSNILSIYGEEAGTDVLTICAIAGGCSAYTVTVTGSTPTTTTAPTTTTTVTPTTTTAPATTVANSALLAEIQTLQTAVSQTLTQLQSIESQLNQLEAQVNAGSGSDINTNVSAETSTGSAYDFTELLAIGSEDAQVTELQQRLTTLGFYSGPVTGYYGSLTEQAVMKYQTAHDIAATGEVGPETRAALNAGD